MYYIFFGLLAGLLSGLFGIGGGIILVPLFIGVLAYSPHQAISLSLITMTFPVFIVSLWRHYQAGNWTTDMIKLGLLVAIGMVIGGYFGATISSKFSSIILRRSFAVLIVFVAVQLWMGKK